METSDLFQARGPKCFLDRGSDSHRNLPVSSQVVDATMARRIAFALWLAERVRRVLAAVDERAHDLVLLGDLLDRLEREPSRSALLRRLSVSLETQGRPASVQIRRLARLVQLLDARKNQFFFPIAAVLLWKTQVAMAVDAWRGAEGPAIAGWLRAVGEFEALCALAAYAAENPADPFPEIVTSGARQAWPRSWPWPGRRCGPSGCACRRWRWGRPCAFRTRSRPENRVSTPRSPGSASSSIWLEARCRCCSCSTNFFTAPIPTTVASAPSRCCAGSSTAVRSA